MNLDEAFIWYHKTTATYLYLGCTYDYLGLLHHWLLEYWWLNNNLWHLHHRCLYDNMWRLHHWCLYDNLWHLHHWCLHDNLWTAMTMMEFRLEMYSSSRLSIEVNLNPFFSWAVLSENIKRNSCFANQRGCKGISVANTDVHLVSEHVGFDLHELECPLRILATVMANCRSPLLLADTNNDEWVHLV